MKQLVLCGMLSLFFMNACIFQDEDTDVSREYSIKQISSSKIQIDSIQVIVAIDGIMDSTTYFSGQLPLSSTGAPVITFDSVTGINELVFKIKAAGSAKITVTHKSFVKGFWLASGGKEFLLEGALVDVDNLIDTVSNLIPFIAQTNFDSLNFTDFRQSIKDSIIANPLDQTQKFYLMFINAELFKDSIAFKDSLTVKNLINEILDTLFIKYNNADTYAGKMPALPVAKIDSVFYQRFYDGTFELNFFSGSKNLNYLNKDSVIYLKCKRLVASLPPSDTIAVIPHLNKKLYVDRYEVSHRSFQSVLGRPIESNRALLPATNLSFVDVVKYCNQRSKNEGFTPVYEYVSIDGSGNFFQADSVAGLVINESANGYRLLSEIEWGVVYKYKSSLIIGTAQSVSVPTYSFYWGNSTEKAYISQYANVSNNLLAIGSPRLPTEAGIFDLSGNAAEMVHAVIATVIQPSKILYKGGTAEDAAGQMSYSINENFIGPNPFVGFRVTRFAN